ncbi:hypothetical protein FH972_024527 [Carpinus fangiana]|uniref:RNase III domain-containing protein n=1 Tax=Carpinus fangiana TaxID=176857 RepID=A0A5N6KZ09_9ROSI|nr:hypothetical protein FH972_024527 [Carpinus fangiana]
MSIASSARPAVRSVCRECRQRLLQPHHQAAFLSSTSFAKATNPTIKLQNESGQHSDDLADSEPRWKRTPTAMKSPFRIRESNDNDHFPVNEDPKKLDDVLKKMLGQGGETMLSEEAKWLAVTHKSFDHGRRGFNDRLAFLGKRIVELQTSLALIDAPKVTGASSAAVDSFARTPYRHPSLSNIESMRKDTKSELLSKVRLSQLANRYGLADVIRWKPKQVRRLKASGIEAVLAHTIYAIVGAIALQRGGDAAIQAVRQKILHPLGIL